MKKPIALLIALGILLTASVSAAVEIGATAPDFTLTDIHGKEYTLSDYRGSYVILEWKNHNCPFVVKFYRPGKMQEWQKQFRDQDVIWLTIDSTNPNHRDYLTPSQHQELAKEWKVASTAFLLDPEGKVGRAYDARTTPHMYIINPEGTLLYNGAIDSIRSPNSDDIARADNYVLMAMEEIKAGKEVSNPQTRAYGCTVKY